MISCPERPGRAITYVAEQQDTQTQNDTKNSNRLTKLFTSTGKLQNIDFGVQPAQKYNTIWSRSRKYNIGQKQKIQYGVKAEVTS